MAKTRPEGNKEPSRFISFPEVDDRPEVQQLFRNLKARLPELEQLLARVDGKHGIEDGVYRFYHQSFKVFYLQDDTKEMVEALASLLPGRPLNKWFQKIVAKGTGRNFKQEDNANWPAATRPIVEACFHARYFLDMAVRYGKLLQAPPCLMPSGWASVLYLFNLR